MKRFMVGTLLTILISCAFFGIISANPCPSDFDSNLPILNSPTDVPPLFDRIFIGLPERLERNQRDFNFLFQNFGAFEFDGDGLIHISTNSTDAPGGKCLFVVQEGENPKCVNLEKEDVPTTFDPASCTLTADGINGKLQFSGRFDAIVCSNIYLDFSSNKNQPIAWTFLSNNPTPYSSTQTISGVNDPIIWPFTTNIAPITAYNSVLKFEITDFPTPVVDFGYEYDITIELTGVTLHDNYSSLNSTVPVHRVKKITYAETPVDAKIEWIQTDSENKFILEKFQFPKPNQGEATQFGLEFELSTLFISDEFTFTIEVTSTTNSKDLYKYTSSKAPLLRSLVYDSKRVTTTYLPTSNPDQFGFKISLPVIVVPLNQVFTLSTNATLASIDSQGLFRPIGDRTCEIRWVGLDGHFQIDPTADDKFQILTFNLKPVIGLYEIGKEVIITCNGWVIEPPSTGLFGNYISYFFNLVDETAVKGNDNFTPAGVSWVALPIRKNDDKNDKNGDKLLLIIVGVVVGIIVVACAVYLIVVLRKKSREEQQELIGNTQYRQVV
jgi:hypothetical protein